MLSRQEREQYFQEVLAHERAIGHKIHELCQALQDSELKGSVDEVLLDGSKHGSFSILLYGVLQGVFEEETQAYSFIRKFLDSILPGTDSTEKRRFAREPLLGLATMYDLENGEVYHVRCMDISPTGVGIENDKAIPVGRSYSLEIKLYRHATVMEKIGRLVWIKEVIPGNYIGGIRFEEPL